MNAPLLCHETGHCNCEHYTPHGPSRRSSSTLITDIYFMASLIGHLYQLHDAWNTNITGNAVLHGL